MTIFKKYIMNFTQEIFTVSMFIVALCFYYYNTYYFHITFSLGKISIEFKWVLTITFLLLMFILYNSLKKKDNSFSLWFYWFFIIIIMATLYATLIQAFIHIENAKDYLIEFKGFHIEIKYTLRYKYYFMMKYLGLMYEIRAKQYIAIGSILFDPEYFKELLKLLDKNILVEEKTLSDIKYKCHVFILNYIEYRLEQANFLVSAHKELLWKNSFLYKFLLVCRYSSFILLAYFSADRIPFLFYKKFDPNYFLQKAANIMTYYFNNHPEKFLFFEGTPLEQQDFFLLLGYFLLREMGSEWVYKQPWY